MVKKGAVNYRHHHTDTKKPIFALMCQDGNFTEMGMKSFEKSFRER